MTARERMEIERSSVPGYADLFWGDVLARKYGRTNVEWVTRNRGLFQSVLEDDARRLMGWCVDRLRASEPPGYWRSRGSFLVLLDIDPYDLPSLFGEP